MAEVSGFEEIEAAGEVLTARDSDCAEPLFVCRGALGAVAGEGVLFRRTGVAGDLLEGVCKILV